MNTRELDLQNTVEPARVGQLLDLYAATWWAADRTERDVAAMLTATDIVFALIDRPADRLVAFARVLTDDTYLALVLDVIVAPDHRETGLGRLLMDAIVSHPRLAAVQSIELVCQPELLDFYRRWGFTDDVQQSRLMWRT